MDIYLVRHAIAGDRDPESWPDDGMRPLTPRGIKAFTRAAGGLQVLVPRIDILLSSPLVRAWHTAELLATHAHFPPPVRFSPLEPDHAPQDVIDGLAEHSALKSIMLVGHEPALHVLASYLLTGDEGAASLTFRKGGVARLDIPSEPGPGTATLRWLVTPRLLRLLASG